MKYTANGDFPENGRYVLIHLTKTNWGDSDDPDGVYWKVAKFVRGLSKYERSALPDDDERKKIHKFGDENWNNLVGYGWEGFGPGSYFGQEVDRWEELPRSNK